MGRCAGGDRPPVLGRGAGGSGGNGSGSTGSSTRPTRSRPASPTGSPSRTGCATSCCVTAPCPRCSPHNGLPVSVGRTQYQVPDRTRRLVLRRGTASVGCRGAPRPAGCRSITSSTTTTTAPPTPGTWPPCAPPTTASTTKAELGITGNADDPDGLTFTDAHGRVIDPATRPIKPTGPPPGGPVKPYEHPLGERLQRWAILFPDPPPGRCDERPNDDSPRHTVTC